MDFAFINQVSHRGFTAYLSIRDEFSAYPFAFPTKNKRPPLDLITWFIHNLNNQGIKPIQIMVDEGGELGRSSEFAKLLVEHNITMDTTGAYSSFRNHDERQHRTLTNLIKSLLYIGNLPNDYWCFALQYGVFLLRRFVNYTSLQKITPYQIWHNKVPDFNKIHLFGSTCYIYDHKNTNIDHTHKIAKFLGYGNNTNHVLATTSLHHPVLI